MSAGVRIASARGLLSAFPPRQSHHVAAPSGHLGPVGDEEQRPACRAGRQPLHEEPFRRGVERRAELVEEQDPSLAEQRAGDGDALRLPFAESLASLSARGVESERQ